MEMESVCREDLVALERMLCSAMESEAVLAVAGKSLVLLFLAVVGTFSFSASGALLKSKLEERRENGCGEAGYLRWAHHIHVDVLRFRTRRFGVHHSVSSQSVPSSGGPTPQSRYRHRSHFSHRLLLHTPRPALGWRQLQSHSHRLFLRCWRFWGPRRPRFCRPLRLPAQAAGAVGGAMAIMEFMPPQYKHMLVGPSLKVDQHTGAIAEGVLTFLISFAALLIIQKGPKNVLLQTCLLSVSTMSMIVAGSGYTGQSMNPVNAFSWAYLNKSHNTWEQYYVYWIFPFIGAILAAWVFRFICPPPAKQKKA